MQVHTENYDDEEAPLSEGEYEEGLDDDYDDEEEYDEEEDLEGEEDEDGKNSDSTPAHLTFWPFVASQHCETVAQCVESSARSVVRTVYCV